MPNLILFKNNYWKQWSQFIHHLLQPDFLDLFMFLEIQLLFYFNIYIIYTILWYFINILNQSLFYQCLFSLIKLWFSVENSYYGSLDLKTELGCLFGLIKLALKAVSFGGYFEWFAGWVNWSVFVQYHLDVAFKVSSVCGMWTPLNLFVK